MGRLPSSDCQVLKLVKGFGNEVVTRGTLLFMLLYLLSYCCDLSLQSFDCSVQVVNRN